MFFNSWQFVVFFAVVYTTYLLLDRARFQNVLILLASYWFYAAWDWRFLGLIVASTIVDYFCGLGIHRNSEEHVRRRWLFLSLAANLGILAFFKYFNFFTENLEGLITAFGGEPSSWRLNVILPVGISFYTFQTMSYTIDIYRGTLKPTRNFLELATFVAFFPQLVAGPIERAAALLPQIQRPRSITQQGFYTGCWLIFWGLWKKIVIADNLARFVDPVFADSMTVTAAQMYLGVVAFAFQIYCDFSGYSDIARGLSRVMGFELMRNFNLPYFALSPSDFWRRWHISLSTWLRDYLYIPLGGNRGGVNYMYRNLALTMLLGGLWHGASWNYVWWGVFHGALLIAFRLAGVGQKKSDAAPSRMAVAFQTVMMFQFTLFGWLLFRATRRVVLPDGTTRDGSFQQITELLMSFRNGLGLNADALLMLSQISVFILPLAFVQWLQFQSKDHYIMMKWRMPARMAFIGGLSWMWLFYGVQQGSSFIYFQF